MDWNGFPTAGSVFVRGEAAAFSIPATRDAGSGSISVRGQDAVLAIDATRDAGSGAVSVQGQDATLAINATRDAGSGSLSVQGQTPTVTVNNVTALPAAGSIRVEGQSPAITAPSSLSPTAGSVALQGQAASWGQMVNAEPAAGIIVIQGHPVTQLFLQTGSVHLQGQEPMPMLVPFPGSIVVQGEQVVPPPIVYEFIKPWHYNHAVVSIYESRYDVIDTLIDGRRQFVALQNGVEVSQSHTFDGLIRLLYTKSLGQASMSAV